MPELPEVETVARQLAPLLAGRILRRIEVRDALLKVPDRHRAQGRRVLGVTRLGKQVAITLGPTAGDPPTCRLLCHLRMTGRLIWLDSGETRGNPRHVRATLRFDAGRVLFVDPRRFGTLRVVPGDAPAGQSGVDPMTRAFTPPALAGLLAGSRQGLKPWLLRQDRLEGIGNIYASEILFHAGLDPRRAAGSLSRDEIGRLHGAVRSVLARAIRHCGTTFSDFGDTRGRPGGFGRLLAVYGREGAPCRACGARVLRLAQQSRSTFYCEHCQGTGRGGTLVASGRLGARR
ncbi:MAG: bifunctional DNA-formamidopyrimidine glycosylase/DNA-(apurinic or apyrimidinic site) lyase [Deltaproteobacteria bacterium]|nr:bifunctional DNA-formamidopyrimidine glycosylase/DNA-(apurinic or apyrimidinic site) lyase [Deltaproteobacteria bacterium]